MGGSMRSIRITDRTNMRTTMGHLTANLAVAAGPDQPVPMALLALTLLGDARITPLTASGNPERMDYEDCVNGRIAKLEKKLYEANEAVETVQVAKESSKVSLIKRLNKAKRKVSLLVKTLTKIKEVQAHIQATIETAVLTVSDK